MCQFQLGRDICMTSDWLRASSPSYALVEVARSDWSISHVGCIGVIFGYSFGCAGSSDRPVRVVWCQSSMIVVVGVLLHCYQFCGSYHESCHCHYQN